MKSSLKTQGHRARLDPVGFYKITVLRREIKSKPPQPAPVNHTWGIDLTTVTLNAKQKLILGIVDHGSRASITLRELTSKHSAVLLREICLAIKQFGFPKYIRTDNEACFSSWWLKSGLKLLGIKKQTSDVASPWQNGRIERFFGTFKSRTTQLDFHGCATLHSELATYRMWYNHIRTHQNLEGRTPAEVWRGKPNQHPEQAQWFSTWHGVLCGYYVPD